MSQKQCFNDRELENYAIVMIWAMKRARAVEGGFFKPNDNIIIEYHTPALPLVEKLYILLIQEGFNVSLERGPNPALETSFYNNANEAQLGFVHPAKKVLYEKANGIILILSPESLHHLKKCDSKKINLRSRVVHRELFSIIEKNRSRGFLGRTICLMPSQALAEEAGLSLSDYTDEIIKACYLSEQSPIEKWRKAIRQIDYAKEKLSNLSIKKVHVQSEAGTDLTVWIGEKRRWIGGSGRNIPSFEVFTTPYAGKVEGVYFTTEPSMKLGQKVEGVKLIFRDGVVTEATATSGQELLISRVNLDEGSKMIGEFSLTDKRTSKISRFMAHTLFDENVGGKHGNCHIALGSSFSECYSGEEEITTELKERLKFNKSAEHWDLIDSSRKIVTAYLSDGTSLVIYQDGMFTNL